MKTLYLLRHAEAAPGTPDHQRALTSAGKMAARHLGFIMQERGYNPAHILCSDARRTRETLAMLAPENGAAARFDEKIYGAGVGDLLAMVQAAGDVSSLLMVGHNPAVHGFARVLAGSGRHVAVLDVQYPPCTLSVLTSDADWADWAPGCAVLADLLLGGR